MFANPSCMLYARVCVHVCARVQMTAAAFAKGFLELEGDLTPLLVSLVNKSKAANTMLDHSGQVYTPPRARVCMQVTIGSMSETQGPPTSHTT